MFEQNIHEIVVLPFVTFTSVNGKQFCIPRDRIIHIETYEEADGMLDHSKTFVNFMSPNLTSKNSLHAVVGMSVSEFRDSILRAAYEPILVSETAK